MLTQYIGKMNTDGTLAGEPAPVSEWQAAYEMMRTSGTMIRIVSKTPANLRENLPSDLMPAISHFIERAEREGQWAVTMRREVRGGPRERIKRQINHARQFPIGEEFQLPIDAALLLLNRYPYNLIFEEIEDESDAQISPPQPRQINPPKRRKS